MNENLCRLRANAIKKRLEEQGEVLTARLVDFEKMVNVLKESVNKELEVLGDKDIYHIKEFKEDLADIESNFAGLIEWRFEHLKLNLVTELVGGIEFSDYTLDERVDLMADENFDVFIEFIKTIDAFDESCVVNVFKTGTQCVPVSIAYRKSSEISFPKLDFSSEIKAVQSLIRKKEKEMLIECKVRVGIFNFDKFKLAIQDKVDDELSKLNEQVSLEYLNRVKENADNAMGIVSIYEEVKNKSDFWELWFYDSQILETFEWLNKEPIDFVDDPQPLEVFDLTTLLEEDYPETFSVKELIDQLKTEDRIIHEFKVDCYLSIPEVD